MLQTSKKIQRDIFLKFKTCPSPQRTQDCSDISLIMKKCCLNKKSMIFPLSFFHKLNFQELSCQQSTQNLFNRWNKCLNFKNSWFKVRFQALIFSKRRPNRKIFGNTSIIFLIENYELSQKTPRVKKFLKLVKKCT